MQNSSEQRPAALSRYEWPAEGYSHFPGSEFLQGPQRAYHPVAISVLVQQLQHILTHELQIDYWVVNRLLNSIGVLGGITRTHLPFSQLDQDSYVPSTTSSSSAPPSTETESELSTRVVEFSSDEPEVIDV